MQSTLKTVSRVHLPVALRLVAPLALAATLLLLLVASASASFGIASFDGSLTNRDGSPDTQAGSHPYQAYTEINFNTTTESAGYEIPDESVKDLKVELPVGFVGDPGATPKCSENQLVGDGVDPECPGDTQVGIMTLVTTLSNWELGVYNMVPPAGVPAEFGVNVGGVLVHLVARVRDGGDYGLTVEALNINQSLPLLGTQLTFWGVPADPSHDFQRCGLLTLVNGAGEPECASPKAASVPPTAFLTIPTACEGPQTTVLHADSWAHPGEFKVASFVSHDNSLPPSPLGVEGCDRLNFEPAISVAPDTAEADTPAGLTVDVRMPEEGLLNPTGRSAADIKDTTVTLPEGVVINPGQAAGLVACQASEDGVGVEGPPSCPLASKVGTAVITTPLLEEKLEGSIYVLQSNPPDIKLLVAASAEGVNLKLVGDVHLDESTGRLTTTFENTPALPFTDLKLAFSGGAQAALATPLRCGTYTTTSDFTPWSTPTGTDAFPTDAFAITSGPGGSPCVSSLPFGPSLTAGATTDQAGGYTGFSLLLQRGDGQQRVSTLRFKTPEGLLGMISKVPLCEEPQAAQGTCPVASQIGHTVVEAGPGPYPLVVPQPGGPAAPIYLTGGYKGAPYGLSIAVPVVAGPFNLGTVVVRALIAVDPRTAQLTITTDQLPSILDGVPTDLRTINAVIDREGFMLNPTSCSPQSFSGTATSIEGATAAIGSHFQVGSCRSLAFKPRFKAFTSAKTSRVDGASLTVRLTSEGGPGTAGGEANIRRARLELPRILPSRLSTLQKACTEAQFDSNPAGCPAESVVGHAIAHTPILSSPLEGPAYFVSHGGAKFPELIMVLQGEGITIDLAGETFISKQGVTSTTLGSVPDAPVSTFELTLPMGKDSALAADGNLCAQKLVMPTEFVGQNGAQHSQRTPIAVEGCPKALRIASRSVKGRKVTVKVYAPAAGKVKVSGKGLTSKRKTAKSHEMLKLTLRQKRAGSLATRLQVSFTPRTGKTRKRQNKSAKVRFGK